MQTATSTPSKKRAPIATTVKAAAAKPLSKAKVNAVPKPMKSGKGSARTLYKYTGKAPEGKTPQMNALIATCVECKKTELDIASFTAQDLVALAVKKGTLTTGQDPLRIFRFYAKRLVDEASLRKR